jgi:hypothetical protein
VELTQDLVLNKYPLGRVLAQGSPCSAMGLTLEDPFFTPTVPPPPPPKLPLFRGLTRQAETFSNVRAIQMTREQHYLRAYVNLI